jgi:hypothetical protein
MLFAFLQPVPGQKQAEEALSNLASQGILGSICVLLAVSLFLAIRALLKAKDDRITDQKSMTDALGKMNDAAKGLAIEMKEHAANQTIEANKTQEGVRNSLGSQEKSFDELKDAVFGLRQEQGKLVASLEARRGKMG